ncbi:cellulase family glycosylhydrolase [Congregicoccus parvus]|uniref:cellulase family glycosylhydrolase n=1 Tax=Congregicoccus parvus TaxID=3081749 RepID=UPI003FA5F853
MSSLLALTFSALLVAAPPVELPVAVPASTDDPLARDVWAEVVAPSGATLRLPAFPSADGSWAVRTTAAEAGEYRLVADSARAFVVPTPNTLPAVRIDPADTRRFATSTGEPYVPIGTNLSWTIGMEVVDYYRARFAQMREAGLNWTRIWMCHWGGLNLDWLPGDDATVQPAPGTLDETVAARWDAVLALAEENGIRVQVVLQHHGQYSTLVNPNWDANPWNAANPGGFLASPADFFTDERARELTRRKYRYIVARFGHSPAVMAWELFNEVHWVDALRIDRDVATVAAWHDEMAAWIRAHDPHRRLVTTSTDWLRTPIYASMDFLQPHLYGADMIAAVRHLDLPESAKTRPVFFGEIGDDNIPLTDAQKAASIATMPPVWSALMGDSFLPAQIWYGERLLESGRWQELAAVAAFLRATRIAERDLEAFQPRVATARTRPLTIIPAINWHPDRPDVLEISTDGRESPALARVPGHVVSEENGARSGFPSGFTLRLVYPENTDTRLVFAGAGAPGGMVDVLVDGAPIARHVWPARAADAGTPLGETTLALRLAAGPREITLRNTEGPDWFRFARFETGLRQPILGAVGRRSDDFIALWVWHRENIHELGRPTATKGTITIDALPPGDWSLTWWDGASGKPSRARFVRHSGGDLALETPSIARHAALVLERR